MRRLRKFVYRNDVELVVHVDPPVRVRVRDLQYCWDMVHDPEADPIPGAVQVLSCYDAGYGDYVVVAHDPTPSAVGDGYIVVAYGRAESEEGEPAPLRNRRTLGSFVARHGATFESAISWPNGPGESVREDE